MWHAIQTITTKEIPTSNAVHRLAKVYCPVTWQPKTRKNKTPRLMAYLPGYFFAYLEPGKHDFAEIKQVPNVMGIVRLGGDYAVIPDYMIETIRSMEDPSGVIRTRYDHYADGEKVRFKDTHRFALREGLIKTDKKKRIYVILDICGRAQNIQVKPQDIEPVN